MNITKAHTGGKTTFSVSGRLDATTAPQLQELLLPEFDAVKKIELNCTGLTYISSAGLRVLLMGEKAAKAKGGSMTLTGVSAEISEIFEITRLSDILTIV